jgi:hypothetical protein
MSFMVARKIKTGRWESGRFVDFDRGGKPRVAPLQEHKAVLKCHDLRHRSRLNPPIRIDRPA